MSRHKRSKPGEGPYPYTERRLYYGTCATHGTRYQSFYKGKIWVKACGKCRREAGKISPGQEPLFGDAVIKIGSSETPVIAKGDTIKMKVEGQESFGRAVSVKKIKGKVVFKIKTTRSGRALLKNIAGRKFKNTPRRLS